MLLVIDIAESNLRFLFNVAVYITLCSVQTLVFHGCEIFVAVFVTVVSTKNTNIKENTQRYC